MSKAKIAVLGIYADYAGVENAVDVLKEAGFRSADISVLFPEKAGSKHFARDKGTRAPEGAAAGAGTGAVLGGALGWLVGIGALAIPGLGLVVAAGPIMGALAGVGVGGVAGGLLRRGALERSSLAGSRRNWSFLRRRVLDEVRHVDFSRR